MSKFSQIETQVIKTMRNLLKLGNGSEFLETFSDLNDLIKDLSKEYYKKPSADEFIEQSYDDFKKAIIGPQNEGVLEDIERNKGIG
jgi:hypothetical protein